MDPVFSFEASGLRFILFNPQDNTKYWSGKRRRNRARQVFQHWSCPEIDLYFIEIQRGEWLNLLFALVIPRKLVSALFCNLGEIEVGGGF